VPGSRRFEFINVEKSRRTRGVLVAVNHAGDQFVAAAQLDSIIIGRKFVASIDNSSGHWGGDRLMHRADTHSQLPADIERALRFVRAFGCATLVLALTACASVPIEPFDDFVKATAGLHKGTDSALATLVPMSEARFLKEVERQPGKIEELMLTLDANDPLSFTVNAYFLKVEQFRNGTGEATQALVSYAELLQQLASPKLLPQETFDDLATELNANAFSAVSAMRGDAGTGAAQSVGLVSSAAIAATHAYLESKRRSSLASAISENQKTLEAYSTLMQQNVSLTAVALNNEYLARAQEFLQLRDPASFAALDRGHILQVQSLRALSDAFADIPRAHASLASAVRDNGGAVAGITSLLESAKRLQTFYDQSVAANRSAAAQARADAATARAAIARSEAENLSLQAASANSKAVAAREAAKKNPSDLAKAQTAKDLETHAGQLRKLADEAAATADALEAAAQQVQQAADAIKKSSGGSD
jgi:hypothetical protein